MIVAGLSIFSVFVLITMAGTGYLLWTAGKYTVSKVQHLVPESVPETLDSALSKAQQSHLLVTCKATILGLFALEPWLSQPLNVTFSAIKTACWDGQTESTPKGEKI